MVSSHLSIFLFELLKRKIEVVLHKDSPNLSQHPQEINNLKVNQAKILYIHYNRSQLHHNNQVIVVMIAK